MKKLLLITGACCILLNLIAGLIFQKYLFFNNVLVSISIISTITLIYFLQNKNNSDAYRITLTFIFGFLGVIKLCLSLYAPCSLLNNIFIFGIIGIIAVEALLLFLIQYMSRHK